MSITRYEDIVIKNHEKYDKAYDYFTDTKKSSYLRKRAFDFLLQNPYAARQLIQYFELTKNEREKCINSVLTDFAESYELLIWDKCSMIEKKMFCNKHKLQYIEKYGMFAFIENFTGCFPPSEKQDIVEQVLAEHNVKMAKILLEYASLFSSEQCEILNSIVVIYKLSQQQN